MQSSWWNGSLENVCAAIVVALVLLAAPAVV